MEQPKRHSVVLLFTDLSASTRVAKKLEPEQYGVLLGQIHGRLQSAVQRHGGEVIRVDGDGALCFFGYPIAYEDAGRRAVAAALDAHQAIEELGLTRQHGNQKLKLHSGIHAGTVLLSRGDIVRGRYEVLGDATNIAARICDAAKPGQILVTSETLGKDSAHFSMDAPLAIKIPAHSSAIKTLPISGLRCTRLNPSKSTQGLTTQLVARQREQRQFEKWLDNPRSSPFIVFHGPSGIGKSKLLSKLENHAAKAGWLTVTGGCDSYQGAHALHPFVEIAKSLLSTVSGVKVLEEADILQTLDTHSQGRRILILLDDWQWADEKSQLLLWSLLDRKQIDAKITQFKFVIASRAAWPLENKHQPDSSYLLEPFCGDDLDEAIQSFLPACDPITATEIKKASGGSPLLLEEVCRAIADGRELDTSSVRTAWYELAVQARVEKLSHQDAELLRICSTIGVQIPLWILASVHGSAINHEQVNRLQNADFLQKLNGEDSLQFKHGMTRDAVYLGIGLAQRRELHGTLAEILKATTLGDHGNQDEALALHLLASENIEEGLPFAIAAADKALVSGALDRAQFHYREAFGGLSQLEQSAENTLFLRHIIKSFGRATVVDPMRDHVSFLEKLLTFAKEVGDTYSIALATYWIGSHYYGLGEQRQSLAVLAKAHSLAMAMGASTFAVQIEANLGQSSAIAAKYEDALRYMDKAVASKLSATDRTKPSTSLAYCQSSRGLIKADMGDFSGAFQDFDASIKALVDMDHPTLLSLESQRCLALIYQGKFEEACDRAALSERKAEKTYARFLVFAARALGKYALYSHTKDDMHFDAFVEATLRLYCSDRLQRISYKLGWICEVMAERGEEWQTRHFAKLTFKRALKGDRLGEASAARALARLSAKSQNSASAMHYLAMADRAAKIRISKRELAINQLCAGHCFADLGDRKKAVSNVERAAASFQELGMRQFENELTCIL